MKETQLNKGFTLIELIVAITVFIAVMTISMGAIFSVFNLNTKSKNIKTALSNLNLSLESMSREIRFGRNYHCGSTGTLTLPQDCPMGASYFSFLASDGRQITYRLNNQSLEKLIGSGNWLRVTSSEISIDAINFFTLGSSASDSLQPKTLIIIRGTVGLQAKGQTRFTMQTLVSQRVVDR